MKRHTTHRLRLEPVQHAAEMFPLLSDPRIYEHLSFGPPATLVELEERYERQKSGVSPDGTEQWLNWIVRSLDDGGACAGFVQATLHHGDTAEFGYIFAPAFWGRGLAFEACMTVLAQMRGDFPSQMLFATVDRLNTRSVTLLARLGFHRIESQEYPHGDVLASDDVFQLHLTPPRISP